MRTASAFPFVLIAAAVAACSESSTAPRSGPPAIVQRVAGDSQAGPVGRPLARSLVVRVIDTSGAPVRGATVRWSATGVGAQLTPASSRTNGAGEAQASWLLSTSTTAPSAAVATVEGVAPTTFTATRTPGALHKLTVTSPTEFVLTSTATRLVVTASDAYANAIPNLAISWTSSDPRAAFVDRDGLVYGATVGGTAVITATAGAISDKVSVRVIERALAMESAGLAEARAGLGFDTTFVASGGGLGYQWRVSGGALPAGVGLHASGRLSGTPTQSGTFAFSVAVRDAFSVEVSRAFSLSVCTAPVSLEPGQSVSWRFPDVCGVVLPNLTEGTYRVGVMARNAPSLTSATLVSGGMQLRARATPTVSGVTSAAVAAPVRTPVVEAIPDDPVLRLMRSTEAVHAKLREADIRDFGSLPHRPLGPPLSQNVMRASAAAPPAQQRSFFANNPFGGQRIQVTATLRYNGPHFLYYEDDAVGTSRATDAEIEDIADYYDRFGKPVIDQMFGGLGPAGTTNDWKGGPRSASDLDGNGKFILLQMSDARMLQGAAGYITSCDRLPVPANLTPTSGSCIASNEGEIAYILRPNTAFYRGVVVHEAKHLASHGYARFAGRGFNPSWVEEGTAEIAAEVSSRRAAEVSERAEVRRADVFPDGLNPSAASYYMYAVTTRARQFLAASPLSAILGDPSPNPGGSSIYGASWLLHRYLADRYATAGEVNLFRQMNTTGIGVPAIEAAVGKPFNELLAELMTAIALEGLPSAKAAASTRFLSYDLADIATRFTATPWPFVEAVAGYGSTSFSLPTYYTSPNFFEFTASPTQTLRLDLLQLAGAPIAANVDGVVVITRVR